MYICLCFVALNQLVCGEFEFNFLNRIKQFSNSAMDDGGDITLPGSKQQNQISETSRFLRKGDTIWNEKKRVEKIWPQISGNETIDTGNAPFLRRSSEHPTRPMIGGNANYQKFRINKVTHPDCRLTQNTYNVFKDQDNENEEIWFTVQLGNRIRKSDNPEMEYDELGFINCSPGWVEMVEIHDDEPLNARGCGISTVLTELCFIDPQLNYLYHPRTGKESNAIKELKEFPDQLRDVVNNCEKVVALRMAATPPKGAYAYFSAAKRWQYNQMLVQTKDGHFHKFWTKDASKKYDKTTGNIGLGEESCNEGCEGKVCKAYEQLWYFCKDK